MAPGVLILGNGLSRLLFEKEIDSFTGEIWACNYAYMERFADSISRLSGHLEALYTAQTYKDENDLDYDIWHGVKGTSKGVVNGTVVGVDAGWQRFSCPPEFHKDTGTTMVAQALHEGLEVQVCGFDLGGPDIISPDLQYQNKRPWVHRWRNIAQVWGLDRVSFWGFDHKEYILGDYSDRLYSEFYMADRVHIDYPGYRELCKKHNPQYSERTLRIGGVQVMKRVRFLSNGYEGVMKESTADVFLSKGKIEILGDVEDESAPTTSPVKDDAEVRTQLIDALYALKMETKKELKTWSLEQLRDTYDNLSEEALAKLDEMAKKE